MSAPRLTPERGGGEESRRKQHGACHSAPVPRGARPKRRPTWRHRHLRSRGRKHTRPARGRSAAHPRPRAHNRAQRRHARGEDGADGEGDRDPRGEVEPLLRRVPLRRERGVEKACGKREVQGERCGERGGTSSESMDARPHREVAPEASPEPGEPTWPPHEPVPPPGFTMARHRHIIA